MQPITKDLSIIIPMRNAAETIWSTLASIKSQSDHGFKSHEIILVDDASTDDTILKVNQSCGWNEVPHKILRHTTNSGVSSARNTGLANAEGEWIIFLDADDQMTKDSLWLRWKWKEKGKFHYGSYDILDHQTNRVIGERILPPFTFFEHFTKNILPCWTGILHRDNILLFNEDMRGAEDYDMTMRLSMTIPFESHIEKTVIYRENRSESLTHDPSSLKSLNVDAAAAKNRILRKLRNGQFKDVNGLNQEVANSINNLYR